jgi:hypothetical protein
VNALHIKLTHSRLKLGHKENNKFWEELIAYFPFIRHGPHRKRRVRQFYYCCVCILCRGNVFTGPLPSNDRGIHIQIHRLMGGIYEVRRSDGLRCHDTHTKFHKDWFRHSNVNGGGECSYTNTQRPW